MRQKFKGELANLNRQIGKMEQEVVELSDGIQTHENVILQQTCQQQSISSKNYQISEMNK